MQYANWGGRAREIKYRSASLALVGQQTGVRHATVVAVVIVARVVVIHGLSRKPSF